MGSILQQMFGTIDGGELLVILLTRVLIVLTILPVHEFAHAWAARKLGDDTAERMGRLSLNPFKHLHWIGSAMLILFGFGFAKPVPVNPYRFRDQEKRRGGMALTALAGPLSNLIMAFIGVLLFCVLSGITESAMYIAFGVSSHPAFAPDLWSYVGLFLFQFALINISLALFNLLPVPPLDGSRIFGLLFPEKWMMMLERYSFLLIVLIFYVFNRIPGVGNIFSTLSIRAFTLLYNVVAWVCNLFGAGLITLGF